MVQAGVVLSILWFFYIIKPGQTAWSGALGRPKPVRHLLPCKKLKKDLDLQVVSPISKTMKKLQWIPNIINNGKVTVNSKYYHEPQPTYNMNENLFRLIFETQIHIHIPVRYFKSLHKASYYSTTIHMKNLYLHPKAHNMGLKWNLYLKSLSRRDPINLSTQTFRNINLTETMTNLTVA